MLAASGKESEANSNIGVEMAASCVNRGNSQRVWYSRSFSNNWYFLTNVCQANGILHGAPHHQVNQLLASPLSVGRVLGASACSSALVLRLLSGTRRMRFGEV